MSSSFIYVRLIGSVLCDNSAANCVKEKLYTHYTYSNPETLIHVTLSNTTCYALSYYNTNHNANNNEFLYHLHLQYTELRGTTSRNIKHNQEQGRTKVIIRARDHRRF